MTEKTGLRERVMELIQSAADNGYYDYDDGMSTEALGMDMLDHSTEVENENLDEIQIVILTLRTAGWKPSRSVWSHPATTHRS
jgi:hypothetical protein